MATVRNALKWIVNEAKKLRREYPRRYKKWKDYVAQASAIYASKHGGKSPVGKKHRRKVGRVAPIPAPQYGGSGMGAVKYLERGEKHNARARIVRVNRTKGGQFKSFKHLSGTAVSAVTTRSKSHVDKNRITANIQVGSVNSRILQAVQDKVHWIEVLEKNIAAAEHSRRMAARHRSNPDARKIKAVMTDNVARWKDLLRAAKKELTVLKRNLR